SSCLGRSTNQARATVIGSKAPPNRLRDLSADFATPVTLPKSRVKILTTRSASWTGQVRKTTASDVSTVTSFPHPAKRHKLWEITNALQTHKRARRSGRVLTSRKRICVE